MIIDRMNELEDRLDTIIGQCRNLIDHSPNATLGDIQRILTVALGDYDDA